MKPKDVRERVAEIQNIAKTDPEAAASKERELYDDVLHAIASGSRYHRALAREAIKATQLTFPRWG